MYDTRIIPLVWREESDQEFYAYTAFGTVTITYAPTVADDPDNWAVAAESSIYGARDRFSSSRFAMEYVERHHRAMIQQFLIQ